MKVKTTVYIAPRVSHQERWSESELYCPNCGVKGIWFGSSEDYYEGVDHLCLNCEHSFTMPRLQPVPSDEKEPLRQIIQQLKVAK